MANNNPRHGDEIITQKNSAQGGSRQVASPQFQQFLDDLGLITANTVSYTDLVQIVNIQTAQIDKLFTEVDRLSKLV